MSDLVKAYRVDVRDRYTGRWYRKFRSKVEYRRETITRDYKFLWWTLTREETVIVNEGEAEDAALERAVRFATARYEEGNEVRVVAECEDWWRGESYTFCVETWRNGKWRD